MRIKLLATGGTIASVCGPDGMWVPTASASDLVAATPGLEQLGELNIEVLDQVNGWNITPERMIDVAERAREALSTGGYDSVIVTHGTDTIEETLYMTQLLAGDATGSGPVVFACAMRAGSEVSADGPGNLLNAARIAVNPQSRGRGVLLTANDRIHHASWLTKVNSMHVEPFDSVVGGPVGTVIGSDVRYLLDSPATPSGRGAICDVPLIKAYTGMDVDVLDWHLEREPRGLVIEGTGAGNVPGAIVPGIEAAIAADVPVVVASRCPYGFPDSPYGGPGGGANLNDLGVLRAGHLNAAKARIALMVALHETRDAAGLREWFGPLQ